MKLTNEYTTRNHLVKEFEIELDNGKTLHITKWWDDDEINGYDNDYEIDENDKKNIFDKLNEEEQDEVMDILNQLTSTTNL